MFLSWLECVALKRQLTYSTSDEGRRVAVCRSPPMLSANVGRLISDCLAGKVLCGYGPMRSIDSSNLSPRGTGREYCVGSIVMMELVDV